MRNQYSFNQHIIMSLIKDIYSPSFYNQFAGYLKKADPSFHKKEFIDRIYANDFEKMEWKDRMKHTTRVLHHFLPDNFPKAVRQIDQLITLLREDQIGEGGLAFVIFPDYIETYGLDNLDTSVKAFGSITQFVSCEFAVRPFIIKYGQKMIDEMIKWSLHKSPAVRRLASEGSRPRLPWAMAIPALKKDPTPILPILENLKNDPSDSVRRSVANNLNDIAKDHPDIVLKIAAKWKGASKEADAIIKHGSRTLLKQGHTEILSLYGLDSKGITLSGLKIATPKVKIGSYLEFSFTIHNENKKDHTVRLEYGIYYRKAKGHLNKKVFKISERIYAPGEKCLVQRRQSFKLITTRKFHTGQHKLSIILNGEEKALAVFTILE